MDRARAWWARLGRAGRPLLVVLPAALIAVLVAVQLAAPETTPGASPGPAPTSAASSAGAASAPASAQPTALPELALGSDGRFTILLLGSDFRGSNPGNRTDTIMIASIAPADGSVVAISIPRDTAKFPLPDGTVYPYKINGLYEVTVKKVGVDAAGGEFRRMLGATLGVEIDAYAFIGMQGLVELIDAIGGVDVTLAKPITDPFYWTNDGVQGISFPAGLNHLDGERALIFARTRKGDSDFQRVRRQQMLVLAAAAKVRDQGVAAIPALLALASKWIRTDVPLDQAIAVFELVEGADFGGVRREVLGPGYATKIPGTVNYELNLDKVRALVADWFAPVPSPAPSPVTPGPSAPGPSGGAN